MCNRSAHMRSLITPNTMTYQYQVSFITAVKRAFSQYCSFHGRASRSEYWWFILFNFIVGGLITAIFGGSGYIEMIKTALSDPERAQYITMTGAYNTVSTAWAILTFLPGLGLLWRRLHDAGHSGWWILWILLPFIGSIILLIILCQRSVPVANKYGPVPNVATIPD